MDGGESKAFKGTFTNEGLALLKVRVKEKLKDLMGDYSDDTLAEYVVVLLRNGRRRDQAAKELQVFLGDDNDAFISWLWDHLSSNLHLYVQPKAVSSSDEAKTTRSSARGLPVCGLTSTIETNCQPEAEEETQRTMRTRQKREWGGIFREESETVSLRSVVANVPHAEEMAPRESHAAERASHKSHDARRTRSPDRHNHRKRSREEDARSTKRASHPVIGAPRRLLQFAVRDAVRPVQPITPRSESASKRLRSVVSTLTSDPTLDVTHVRLRNTYSDVRAVGATAALKAAAEDVKDSFSGSVFDRLGRVRTTNSTDKSHGLREQEPEDAEYENLDNIRAQNQVEFHEKNQYGGRDAYMHDRETEEAAGSAQSIDVYNNNSATRHNGLGSRQSKLPSNGGKESLVVGYVRTAAEVTGRRLIAQGTHVGSGPRPSGKILNVSVDTSARKLPTHEARNAVKFEPQVPMEKKGPDSRKSNVTIAHVNDAAMTDKSKDLIHSSSMVETQNASSVAIGSHATGQPEGGADSRTVFVSNVHFGASKDALSRHFNKFGAVLKTFIVTDVSGQPTGSAYIEFLHRESAEQALTLNGTSFMSRILKVVRKSSIEVSQLPGWTRASRGSPFASRLIRTAYPRPSFLGAIRGRLPLRGGGARSLQWKRDAVDSTEAGKPSHTTPTTTGNHLVTPTTRSFTYTRTEPKPNDGAMV